MLIRLIRVNLLQTMQGDYVEAARARGVSERRVVVHHAFRNALVPVVTVAGLQFAILLGGAVLTEETFNWPGIGSELVRYLNQRDYIAVQGIVTVFAIAVVIVSLLIDLINAFIDPRVQVPMTDSAASPRWLEPDPRGATWADLARSRSSGSGVAIVALLRDPGGLRAADRARTASTRSATTASASRSRARPTVSHPFGTTVAATTCSRG